MTTPFNVAATLQLPSDPSLPADPIPFNVAGNYTSLASEVLNLTGSGSQPVSFGTVSAPGAKGVFIRVDPNATPTPVNVKINSSSTGQLEISPGGELLYVNPNPTTGITALDIVFTAACVVRVWILG